MSAPAPQLAAVDLWNRLGAFSRDDGVELDRIIWQLRKLAVRYPADFVTRSALARALLMRGRRGEALPHVDAAFALRYGQEWDATNNLAGILLDCGRLRESEDILTRLLNSSGAVGSDSLYETSIRFSLRKGDFSFLKKAIHSTRIECGNTNEIIVLVERGFLAESLRKHQKIVESVLGSLTCTFGAKAFHDSEGVLCVSLEYYTERTGRPRLELYRQLALAKLHEELVGLSPHLVIGICGPQVQPLENAE